MSPVNWRLCGLGFERSKSDTCLYVHRCKSTGKWVMIAVFVDDLLVTGTDRDKICELKDHLNANFIGDVAWAENVSGFLGIAIQI